MHTLTRSQMWREGWLRDARLGPSLGDASAIEAAVDVGEQRERI
jgi:hypothetical protein